MKRFTQFKSSNDYCPSSHQKGRVILSFPNTICPKKDWIRNILWAIEVLKSENIWNSGGNFTMISDSSHIWWHGLTFLRQLSWAELSQAKKKKKTPSTAVVKIMWKDVFSQSLEVGGGLFKSHAWHQRQKKLSLSHLNGGVPLGGASVPVHSVVRPSWKVILLSGHHDSSIFGLF